MRVPKMANQVARSEEAEVSLKPSAGSRHVKTFKESMCVCVCVCATRQLQFHGACFLLAS